MKKLIKDRRAGSHSIVFIVLLVITLFVLANFIVPVKIAFSEWVLSVGYKKGLDAMQQQGGLTPAIEKSIKDYLKFWGFNENNIVISGTIAPTAGTMDSSHWGKNIGISIDYILPYKSYTWTSLISFSSEDKAMPLHIEGSTTNYYFDNN